MTVFLSEQDAARLGIGGSKGTRRLAKAARERRPDIPRTAPAARGEGDRVPALMELAAAGYTCTHCDGVSHWMSGAAGTTPRVSSYREMIEAGLVLVKGHR